MSESIKFFYPKKGEREYTSSDDTLIIPNGTIEDIEVRDFLSNPNYIDYMYETMRLVIMDFSIDHPDTNLNDLLGKIGLFERKTYDILVRRYFHNADSEYVDINGVIHSIGDKRIKPFESLEDITTESEKLTKQFCEIIR